MKTLKRALEPAGWHSDARGGGLPVRRVEGLNGRVEGLKSRQFGGGLGSLQRRGLVSCLSPCSLQRYLLAISPVLPEPAAA